MSNGEISTFNPSRKMQTGLRELSAKVSQFNPYREIGEIREVNANRIVTNLQDVFVGEKVMLHQPGGRKIASQVVAFHKDSAILSPLQGIDGLSASTRAMGSGEPYSIAVGDELIGRVIDGLGNPMDEGEMDLSAMLHVPIAPQGSDALARPVIDAVFETGIKSIDGFNTVGQGQRMAIFGEAGAGKSTLLSMLARHSEADVVVLAMIGERGREVNEFLERQLPPKVRERCVVVASTSDRPAMERIMAAHCAATIAEQFRAKGKRVLMLFDSVTRYARALREVGLASGEQAVRSGFTPSVYAELPKLIERTGRTREGAITAFFTVLVENDGVNDPVAEEVASLTDGHLILDATLARSGVYPAINILKSKSRLMNEIMNDAHIGIANRIRKLMSKYLDLELLVQVGEYASGSDPFSDQAIAIHDLAQEFLTQHTHEFVSCEAVVEGMQDLLNATAQT